VLSAILCGIGFRGVVAATSRVLLLRHCVRVTAHDSDIAGYATAPMPAWPSPAGWCTPRGLELARATGADLVKDFGVPPSAHEVRIFADNFMRCVDTAQAVAAGMGLSTIPVTFDAVLFNTLSPKVGTPVCTAPTNERVTRERVARRSVVPMPWDFETALAELQSIIGVGPLGPLSGLGGLEFDATGKPTGSVEVMKLFGQLMVYAYASDLPFANVTEATASRFLAWQHWYRSVVDYTSEKAVANTHLLRQMLSSLLNQAKADIFVGHDGNLDAIAALLDLTWEAPPFLGGNLLPTPPNSGLLFELDLDSDVVEISFVYRVYNTTDTVLGLSRSHVRSTSLASLSDTATQGLRRFEGAQECFDQFRVTVV